MRRLVLLAVVVMAGRAASAAPGFSLEPSIEIREVQDDNLNFSDAEPLRDQIRRITPTLEARYDSPRLSVLGSYGLDSERFARHTALDNARARERGGIRAAFEKSARLQLSFDGGFVNTDMASELNLETGLAESRMRGRRVALGPSMRYRLSPRLTAIASVSAVKTSVENGEGSRAYTEILSLVHQIAPRDTVNVAYEHSDVSFDGETPLSLNTQLFLARWSHTFNAKRSMTISAGPRFTDGVASADFSVSLTQNWKSGSAELSASRTQTTVIGYPGAVETESIQARLSYAPTGTLTAYVVPAFMRSAREQFEGRVHRIGAGLRFAMTSLIDVDVAYSLAQQDGAIDPLRAASEFSRSTLSLGFVTRWSTAGRQASSR